MTGAFWGTCRPLQRLATVPTFECPTCRKAFTVEEVDGALFRPFCSERCKMVDLGRWLDGSYKVSEPANPADLEESGAPADE